MANVGVKQPEGSPFTDREWTSLSAPSRCWINKQHDEVVDLRARLRTNSTNSSKPPSSDPPGTIKRQRTKSSRRPGGQPGHPGHYRPLVPLDRVNQVEDVFPKQCRSCGTHLLEDHADGQAPLRHQVAEIPQIKPFVTEYRRHRASCPECGTVTVASLPQGVPTGCFGANLRSLLVVLSGRFRLSRREVVQFCEEVLTLSISVGCVDDMCRRVGDGLRPPVQEVEVHVRTALVVHADESGWSQKGERRWIWVAVTREATCFWIDNSRGPRRQRSVGQRESPGILGFLSVA